MATNFSETSPPLPNNQGELARERNRIAADRTLLAWIRLSLTLIGIGFGVDQTMTLLYQDAGIITNQNELTHGFGLALVSLGVYALTMAAIGYRGELHRLNQTDYRFTPRWRLGETVAIALMVISLIYLVNLAMPIITSTVGF